jgi:hypothetical protein
MDFPLPMASMIIPFLSVSGSLPPNVHPYHHPFSQKNEIEKIVQEFLKWVLFILVPTPILLMWSWYSSKEGTWCMCPDFKMFPQQTHNQRQNSILVIDDLLDELSGAQYFTRKTGCTHEDAGSSNLYAIVPMFCNTL